MIEKISNGKLGFYLHFNYPRKSVVFAKDYFANYFIDVLEVGVREGFNIRSITNLLNIKSITGVDISFDVLQYDQFTKVISDSISYLKNCHTLYDFIYLDSDHSTSHLLKELMLSFNLLRKGGILAGHDINNRDVQEAVFSWCNINNFIPHVNFMDWWIIKEDR